MDEQSWLTSTDPAAMLAHIDPPGMPKASLRKLRFFIAESFRYLVGRGDPPATLAQLAAIAAMERLAEDEDEDGLFSAWQRAKLPTTGIAVGTVAGTRMMAQACTQYTMPDMRRYQCGVLRCLFGNPWAAGEPIYRASDGLAYCPAGRVVAYPKDMPSGVTLVRGEEMYRVCRWLTPTVLALAEAAYRETGEVCGRCGGRKGRIDYRRCENCNGVGCEICDNDGGIEHWQACDNCHGSGTTSGHLDAGRLAVLADCLEEAGCTATDLLQHLRGLKKCPNPRCLGWLHWHPSPGCKMGQWDCDVCTRLDPGDPMLHVRGCHALDQFLGR